MSSHKIRGQPLGWDVPSDVADKDAYRRAKYSDYNLYAQIHGLPKLEDDSPTSATSLSASIDAPSNPHIHAPDLGELIRHEETRARQMGALY